MGVQVLRVEQDLVCYLRRDVPYVKARPQRRERERDFLGVLLIGVEGHSEALSDGVRCGLSLVALELALCMVELAIVYSYVAAHGADVFGEVLPRCGRLKPRLRGSLAKAVSLKWSVKIAAIEDTLEVLQEIVQACVMKVEQNESSGFRRERERGFLGVLLLGVEGHSEALSDGVRCGLSLVALELALCTDVLGEVLPRYGRLKPRLKGRLAKVVSFKWSVKIAAVEDSELR
ncbi:hypothetical protein DY000_02047277 [Brassica cretica]|uniref:Uncharacterized protein n=1 Tax=Brassica cretica TaxID=69181 RepID=A0ABQ7F9A0_BRACR|nr:hypothetical protein DY000_02047277 [Brassica cretica]